MGAYFDNWPVFDADHMTSIYFDVKWIYMSSGPDFPQDSEFELSIFTISKDMTNVYTKVGSLNLFSNIWSVLKDITVIIKFTYCNNNSKKTLLTQISNKTLK